MLVGQDIGPFKIDKELGSGAMGSVFRGVYLRTGQKVAIKIMAPALAANTHAVKRFEREANILKKLKHPNIVRFYGAKKYLHMPYYAMEYIEGEPLDRVLARGRMTWEKVVDLGLQLCDALGHAHDRGVVHRDLKPSNLMILRDGTLKLTDFGIGKVLDNDLTQLTEQNCTVGTAAYMSPEQCKGERNLSHKSDLYSLGVVFYELLTGRKPFIADNAMDMFMLHVQGTFERPSKLVLDIPVWLDNLVCHLLEKKPEHRPFNAQAVHNTLESIQEKVEAQQSAGVDAVRARRIDRLNNQPRSMDETDREAARTLAGKKVRKKGTGVPFYRTGWFVGLGVLAVLAGMGLVLWLLLQPASPERLYARAEKLMASKDPEDWEKALRGPIALYLKNYRTHPGPQTEQIKAWESKIEVDRNERLLMKYLRKKTSAIKVQAQNDAETLAFKGVDAEEEGDLEKAKDIWTKLKKTFGGSGFWSWGALADEHLKMLDGIKAVEPRFRERYDALFELERNPSFQTQEEEDTFLAFWYRWFGDPVLSLKEFQDLHKKYQEQPEKRSGPSWLPGRRGKWRST